MLDIAGGLPEVIAATTNGNTNRYLQVGGQLLAQQEAGAWAVILPDHLGSVRQVVNPDGYITLGQSYSPFGDVMESAGSGESAFGFTGEQQNGEMVYLRARYYTPGVGRFISRDPFRGWQAKPYSQHPYQYGYSNPVRYTDRSGRCVGNDCPPPTPEEIQKCVEELGWGSEFYCQNGGPAWLHAEPLPAQPPASASPLTLGDMYDPRYYDGYVRGLSIGLQALPVAYFFQGGKPGIFPSAWDEIDCMYHSISYGIEVVWDFNHQERGVFVFHATGDEWGTLVSEGVSSYHGFTSNFDKGIRDYVGLAGTVGISVDSPFDFISGEVAFGVPYDSNPEVISNYENVLDVPVNPNGVYAVYFGASLGFGDPFTPISADLSFMHSNVYELGEMFFTDYFDRDNNDRIVRITRGFMMDAEIRALNGGIVNPATVYLWAWALFYP